MENFGLYLVMTNPAVGYAKCAEAAVKAGVGVIQLRMKNAPRAEIAATAREIRAVTKGSNTLFIVNDDPSIAAETEADGVHVGQGDMPVGEVRRLFPSLRIVGLSTHSMAQAMAAKASEGPARPDYIGVGPVWATPTKAIPDPVLGPEEAVRIISAMPFPCVAIGGIDAERLPALRAAGVANYAVVRAVCRSEDPYAAIRALQGAR